MTRLLPVLIFTLCSCITNSNIDPIEKKATQTVVTESSFKLTFKALKAVLRAQTLVIDQQDFDEGKITASFPRTQESKDKAKKLGFSAAEYNSELVEFNFTMKPISDETTSTNLLVFKQNKTAGGHIKRTEIVKQKVFKNFFQLLKTEIHKRKKLP